MNITITGRGFELTEAIKDYTEKKIGGLEKFYDQIIRAEVKLSKETDHHQKGEMFSCECKLVVPGNDLFAAKTEVDLYKAIDKVRDHLEAEIKQHKILLREKIKKNKKLVRDSKEYQN